MCGRYSLTSPVEAMGQLFLFEERPNLQPRYNIAPTQEAPVVGQRPDGKRGLAMLRWGLVPGWAKDLSIGARMINARAETVAEKPAFRAAFRRRRCLVAADGFYEWKKAADSPKRPYRAALADGGPFGFAGLWETWRGPEGPVKSFTIITTDANPLLAEIHDRMPVILDPADHARWLDPAAAARDLLALLKPYPAEKMTAYPVDRRVGKVQNDDPGLIEPLTSTLP